MSTCNWLDFRMTRLLTDYVQNFLGIDFFPWQLSLHTGYPKHHGLGGMIFWTCFFFVDPDVQMIPNRSENLHDTQRQHMLNIYCWKF